MKRTPLKRGTSQLKRTPLKKSGTTKAKKVARQKAFYSSAAWKRLRKEALERAGNQCQYAWFGKGETYLEVVDGLLQWVQATRCQETERLEIHHKTNARFGGDELPEDLACLCKAHHQLLERRDFPHRQRSR